MGTNADEWSAAPLIEQLLQPRTRPGDFIPMSLSDIMMLCVRARAIFQSQPVLLELDAPVNLCGDIHGQYHDLLKIFGTGGFPPEVNYLFLGDYVDRGRQSLETICLLFALKVQHPENIFLLRGNHEEENINRIYGFYDECRRRYSVKLWRTFIDVFNYMPIAGLIESRIFCMHGGIPHIQNFSFDRLRSLQRPITNVPNESAPPGSEERMITDLMWADPAWPDHCGRIMGYGDNFQRGTSHVFGPDALSNFMDAHELDLIARAHECVPDGFKFFSGSRHNKGCITIFSAPNYGGEDNGSAFVSVNEHLVANITVLAPPSRMREMRRTNAPGT